jgi:peptide/nickel transport system ATP-binding protein
MIFITHDLGIIAEIADQVAVMYQGKIVEYGSVWEIFSNPQHPYTKGLLACRPNLTSGYAALPTVSDFMEVVKPAERAAPQIRENPRMRGVCRPHPGQRDAEESQAAGTITGAKAPC